MTDKHKKTILITKPAIFLHHQAESYCPLKRKALDLKLLSHSFLFFTLTVSGDIRGQDIHHLLVTLQSGTAWVQSVLSPLTLGGRMTCGC
ncbi:hypothetical protein CEXT_479071 [Caerostris extrusa]|uniref:Uncharacterized protein n=1 Tax=Caerostris extrusa TaxID=172846 RepID=A0AAV4ULB1_CAEEX|nr:hypothetical protein CEXT_479071 [Caerostris extrusa]